MSAILNSQKSSIAYACMIASSYRLLLSCPIFLCRELDACADNEGIQI